MGDLIFYDASVPPASPPAVDGVAFYIGGDTPHVWSKAEIAATKTRYRLPIFVRSNPGQANGFADGNAAAVQLAALGAPRGCVLALDTETAADPAYVHAFYSVVHIYGYVLLDYGSQADVFGNEVPAGAYYWGADWTGAEHIDQGDEGTQYANLEGAGYDLSAFRPGIPFWDTDVSRETNTDWQAKMMQALPTIGQGATGNAVKTVQALCTARGMVTKIDGVFGPDTNSAVRSIQIREGLKVDGIVGPATWPVLLGVA